MAEDRRAGGMRSFIVIWIGQFFSILGTGMTNLGIPIWVYAQTGRATDLTTIGGLYVASLLVASLFTGVLVDRSNRKLMMIISDAAAMLVTVGLFILYSLGVLEVWHLYVSAVIQGAFQSIQWPAFSSAISVMVSKENYTRASTMMEMAGTGSQILAPVVAGALLGALGNAQGLQLILLLDIVTASIAVGTLFVVRIPQPKVTAAQQEAQKGGFFGEVLFGFRYILKRPSLLGLQAVFMLGNFFFMLAFALLAPMLLARTNSNEMIFGSVQSIAAVGGLIGGIVISAWGGFKKRVHGVLLGWAATALFGMLVLGLGRAEPVWMALPVWGAGAFASHFFSPLINGSNQAIWQAKVSPDVQGKVFSIRRLIAWIVMPLAQFISGPLADQVLEPGMSAGGALEPVFGWLVGTGPGAGMSLLYILAAAGGIVVGLGAYAFPVVRDAETLLPDHDAEVEQEAVLEASPA